MKNRWPVNLSAFTVEPLDTSGFLKKVRDYDSRLQSKRRGELTAAQKDQLDSYENQIVSLTGWLVLAYAGPPETTNCGNAVFHDWHLEIFESPSDHAPRIGDPRPIICEVIEAIAFVRCRWRNRNFAGSRSLDRDQCASTLADIAIDFCDYRFGGRRRYCGSDFRLLSRVESIAIKSD
jgi:hypothetical protein